MHIDRATRHAYLEAFSDPAGGVMPGGRRVYRDPVTALISAGVSLIGGSMASDAQSSAANTAADAQTRAAQLGVDEQRREFDLSRDLTMQGIDERKKQFESVRQLLSPYVNVGPGALNGQMDLTGANGPEAQQRAIAALQQTPGFQSQLKLGENRILQNASATGGLRGGNTQGALAYFAPSLLAQTINDQYTRLGGLTSLGLNAAGGVGNAGMAEAAGIGGALGQLGSGALTTGQGIAGLFGQIGSAQAGAAVSAGNAQQKFINSGTDALGRYIGGGGRFGGIPAPDAIQAAFSQTPAGYGGFGTGAAYGNQDFGLFI